MRFERHQWAVILGGSSGFGLATAQKLAEHGMNCFIVHRDRRGAMARIEPEFDAIRAHGVELVTVNADALDSDGARANASTVSSTRSVDEEESASCCTRSRSAT